MRKLIVIVLALAIIMTGCFAIPTSYLTNRESYIKELIDSDVSDEQVLEQAELAINPSNYSPSAEIDKSAGKETKKNIVENRAIIGGINAIRKENGLSPVSVNQELERGAHIRAEEASYQFNHYRPDGTPCTSVSELADGEILAIGPWSGTEEDFIDCWMSSPSHRDAILKPYEMEAGAGVYYNYDEQTACWSVLFHIVK